METTAYRPDGRMDYAAMLERTERCLLAGTPVICEAAFSWYGNYCAADILKKTASGYELYEVKNAPRPRREFLIDLGFQSYLIRKSGCPWNAAFSFCAAKTKPKEKRTGAGQR